jgi:hypothetical protein
MARTIIDSNRYMTLATADPSGRPWASPVYFAANGYRELFWVSPPEATHSRNIAERPEVGIVIFDSTVPINTGRGVYMAAVAELLDAAEVERGIGIFSSRSKGARGRGVDGGRRAAAGRPASLPRRRVRALAPRAGAAPHGGAAGVDQRTPTRSTTKTSVSSGPITPPAPRLP